MAKRSDRIIVESQKVGQAARQGEILEIIEASYGRRYRVLWDDGHESTIRPAAGGARIMPGGRARLGARERRRKRRGTVPDGGDVLPRQAERAIARPPGPCILPPDRRAPSSRPIVAIEPAPRDRRSRASDRATRERSSSGHRRVDAAAR